MNHRTASQHVNRTGWHMTEGSRRVGTHPVGYCRDHAPHPTEAEARECYAQYQRDRVREHGTTSWTNCSHAGCGAPARRRFEIEGDGYAAAVLCDEHATIENARTALRLDGPAGDSWFS